MHHTHLHTLQHAPRTFPRGNIWQAAWRHAPVVRKGAACHMPCTDRTHTRLTVGAVEPQRSPLDSDDYDDAQDDSVPPKAMADGSAAHFSSVPQQDPAAGQPGGGFVGFFVAAWMALLAFTMQLLSPIFSLSLFIAQPLTHTNPARARSQVEKWVTELPQGFWARLHYLWERPLVKSIRITASIANWSVRLPAIAALLLAQGGALASTISFPMLAPLLLGTGMMMNSIKANASFIIPRLGLMVVLLWMLWFLTNVIQTTWVVLRSQGRIDMRTLAGARMITECTSLLLASIVVLSMLGINISALLLPAGVVVAIASRDLLQNFIAGFFLVLAQPFRLGDKVAISCAAPGSGTAYSATAAAATRTAAGTISAAAAAASGNGYSAQRSSPVGGRTTDDSSSSVDDVPPGWFEGICEKVDLRYTVLRDGRRRLMVPNTAFVSREFLVYDEGPEALRSSSSWWWQHNSTHNTPQEAGGADGAKKQRAHAADSTAPMSHSKQQQGGNVPREPAIVEGHMTTQLPPLGQPLFPGMHFVAPHHPAYAPFAPMHYQQQPLPYQYQAPLYGQQQQQQPEAVFGSEEWQQQEQELLYQQQLYQHQQHQHQQDQDLQQHLQHQQQLQEDEAQQEQQQQQQQQQEEEDAAPRSTSRSRPVAKGPPGYLPQGFATGPPYLGIPVGTLYYGVPGVVPWGAGPGQSAAQPSPQQAAAAPAAGKGDQARRQQQQQRARQPNAKRSAAEGKGDGDGDDDDSSGSGGSRGNAEGSAAHQGGASGGAAKSPAQPPGHDNNKGLPGGHSASAQASRVSARAPLQQQYQSQVNQAVQLPAHSIHMAGGVGFGMWGMAPAAMPPPPYPNGSVAHAQQLIEPQQLNRLLAGKGGDRFNGAHAKQQQQQGQPVAQHEGQQQQEPTARPIAGTIEQLSTTSAAADAGGSAVEAAAAADAKQSSFLVFAVLQELKWQQS